MPLKRIRVNWQAGFVGTEQPPHEMHREGGCPLFENVRLSPGGVSVKAIRGLKLVSDYLLEDRTNWALDTSKKVVLFDGAVCGVAGVGVAWVDYTLALPNRRVLALAVNRNLKCGQVVDPLTGASWDPSTQPILVLDEGDWTAVERQGRMGPDEYPDLIEFGRATYCMDRWARGFVLRGGAPQPAGLLTPRRKPVLHAAGVATVFDDGATAWTGGTGVTVEVIAPGGSGTGASPYAWSSANVPAFDSGADSLTDATQRLLDLKYLELHMTADNGAAATIAYRNAVQVVGATVTRIRFGIFWAPETSAGVIAEDAKPGRVLPAGTLALVLATGTGATLATGAVEVEIDRELQAGRWIWLDLPWTGGALTTGSWGLRQLKAFPSELFDSGYGVQIKLDGLALVVGSSGVFTGEWRCRVTLKDPKSGLESAPSPESDPIEMGSDGGNLSVRTAGFRGFFDTAERGFASDPVGVNWDPMAPEGVMHVWLSTPDYGEDPTNGGRLYKRLTMESGLAAVEVI